MPFTLHTHSGQFCYHAHGTLEELIKAGVAARLTFMGLSEHMPRTRAIDLYPEELEADATPTDLSVRFTQYVAEARRLRDLYREQLPILIGMETEHIYSAQSLEVSSLCRMHELDYVIGSVHHVHGHPIDFNQEMLAQAQAASAQFEMLQQVKPEVIGHMDLIRRLLPIDFTWSSDVWRQIRINAKLIASYGGLVEINTAAWKYGLTEPYPQSTVIKILQEEGCRFTISDDAHHPNQVAVFHNYRLRDYLQQCDITTIYGLEPKVVDASLNDDTDNDDDKSTYTPFTRVQPVAYNNIHEHKFWQFNS
ncbi:putative histidinol-phosphatase [Syncephalis plumigaleata]|nr:putative histidinol-phosphatase [Syncephalis plumigaleata]